MTNDEYFAALDQHLSNLKGIREAATDLVKHMIGTILFEEDLFFKWDKPVRALTVRGINLVSQKKPLQWDFFNDAVRHEKRQAVDDTVDILRGRFGMNCIIPSSLVRHTLTEKSDPHDLVRMPGMMYQ